MLYNLGVNNWFLHRVKCWCISVLNIDSSQQDDMQIGQPIIEDTNTIDKSISTR